jgi:hypothetical protein
MEITSVYVELCLGSAHSQSYEVDPEGNGKILIHKPREGRNQTIKKHYFDAVYTRPENGDSQPNERLFNQISSFLQGYNNAIFSVNARTGPKHTNPLLHSIVNELFDRRMESVQSEVCFVALIGFSDDRCQDLLQEPNVDQTQDLNEFFIRMDSREEVLKIIQIAITLPFVFMIKLPLEPASRNRLQLSECPTLAFVDLGTSDCIKLNHLDSQSWLTSSLHHSFRTLKLFVQELCQLSLGKTIEISPYFLIRLADLILNGNYRTMWKIYTDINDSMLSEWIRLGEMLRNVKLKIRPVPKSQSTSYSRFCMLENALELANKHIGQLSYSHDTLRKEFHQINQVYQQQTLDLHQKEHYLQKYYEKIEVLESDRVKLEGAFRKRNYQWLESELHQLTIQLHHIDTIDEMRQRRKECTQVLVDREKGVLSILLLKNQHESIMDQQRGMQSMNQFMTSQREELKLELEANYLCIDQLVHRVHELNSDQAGALCEWEKVDSKLQSQRSLIESLQKQIGSKNHEIAQKESILNQLVEYQKSRNSIQLSFSRNIAIDIPSHQKEIHMQQRIETVASIAPFEVAKSSIGLSPFKPITRSIGVSPRKVSQNSVGNSPLPRQVQSDLHTSSTMTTPKYTRTRYCMTDDTSDVASCSGNQLEDSMTLKQLVMLQTAALSNVLMGLGKSDLPPQTTTGDLLQTKPKTLFKDTNKLSLSRGKKNTNSSKDGSFGSNWFSAPHNSFEKDQSGLLQQTSSSINAEVQSDLVLEGPTSQKHDFHVPNVEELTFDRPGPTESQIEDAMSSTDEAISKADTKKLLQMLLSYVSRSTDRIAPSQADSALENTEFMNRDVMESAQPGLKFNKTRKAPINVPSNFVHTVPPYHVYPPPYPPHLHYMYGYNGHPSIYPAHSEIATNNQFAPYPPGFNGNVPYFGEFKAAENAIGNPKPSPAHSSNENKMDPRIDDIHSHVTIERDWEESPTRHSYNSSNPRNSKYAKKETEELGTQNIEGGNNAPKYLGRDETEKPKSAKTRRENTLDYSERPRKEKVKVKASPVAGDNQNLKTTSTGDAGSIGGDKNHEMGNLTIPPISKCAEKSQENIIANSKSSFPSPKSVALVPSTIRKHSGKKVDAKVDANDEGSIANLPPSNFIEYQSAVENAKASKESRKRSTEMNFSSKYSNANPASESSDAYTKANSPKVRKEKRRTKKGITSEINNNSSKLNPASKRLLEPIEIEVQEPEHIRQPRRRAKEFSKPGMYVDYTPPLSEHPIRALSPIPPSISSALQPPHKPNAPQKASITPLHKSIMQGYKIAQSPNSPAPAQRAPPEKILREKTYQNTPPNSDIFSLTDEVLSQASSHNNLNKLRKRRKVGKPPTSSLHVVQTPVTDRGQSKLSKALLSIKENVFQAPNLRNEN